MIVTQDMRPMEKKARWFVAILIASILLFVAAVYFIDFRRDREAKRARRASEQSAPAAVAGKNLALTRTFGDVANAKPADIVETVSGRFYFVRVVPSHPRNLSREFILVDGNCRVLRGTLSEIGPQIKRVYSAKDTVTYANGAYRLGMQDAPE